MSIRSRLVTSVLVSSLTLGSGAAIAADGDCRVLIPATETTPETSVCRQDVWLHQGTQKAGNLAGAGQSTLPSWNTTKPTGQVEGGAGGGYATMRLADIAAPADRTFRPAFEGKFTGVLDNLAADLYLTTPVYQATGSAFPMLVQLKIDGEIILDQSAEEIDVPIQATDAGEGQIGKIQFAFTNINAALKSFNLANDAATEHTIEINVVPRYWGDAHTIIFYDEAQVPSGLIFNHEKPAGYTLIKTL